MKRDQSYEKFLKLDKPLHSIFKVICVNEDKSIKEKTTELVVRYIKKYNKEHKKFSKSELELAGIKD